MRIAIKYCGGCNPVIDRTRVVEKLERLVQENWPEWKFSPYYAGNFDVVVLINGCPTACTDEQFKDADFPVLRVAGELLDGVTVSEKELPGKLLEKLIQLKKTIKSRSETA